MSEFLHIGVDAPRPEGADKIAGRSRYIHDITVPGMLHGAIKFSEHAHARILHVDTSRAERLPGVRAVITAKNTPVVHVGFLRDNCALKGDKVRGFRDEVAAVAAIDAETAQAAIDLITVVYEPLPGVFTTDEAMADGATLVHETDARGKPVTSNVVPLNFGHKSGDLENAKSDSAFVVEGSYSVPKIQQSCMGTAGCIAEFDGTGNLTLTAKTQIPFLAQRDFNGAMKSLGLEGKNVRVVVPELGGAFGSGLDTHCYEYIAILLAWKSGKPVKVQYNRQQEFEYLSPRQSAQTRVVQGCDNEGRLTFREIEVTQDNGAYTSWGATYPSVMLLPVTSLYRVPVVHFQSTIVYTNNTYCQAMRGYGNPEVTFPIETNLDQLAEKAGIDPLEMRRINCNEPGEHTPMGLKVTTCGLRECLDVTADKLNWRGSRDNNTGRGVGMASLIHVGGGGKIYRSDGSGIIIKLNDYGHANVSFGGVEMGQGLHSALTKTVAEGLGIKPEDVTINQTDTATCPWDVGTHASRGAFMACNAALKACAELRAKLFDWAVEIYPAEIKRSLKKAGDPKNNFDFNGIKKEDFRLSNGTLSVEGAPDNPLLTLDVSRLIRAIHFREDGRNETLAVQSYYEPDTVLPDWEKGYGNMSANYTYGTQGVEVEVDTDTGEVKILKLVSLLDVGRVLNPQTLRGQVIGGIAQGVGYALYEQIISEKGRILNPGFTDYKIPTASEMDFHIEMDFIETNDPSGPFGAKGVGEPGLVPTAAAIANAIYNAVGVYIYDLPITPEKVLAALEAKVAQTQVTAVDLH
ncbi:MAG: xanthine dehydrogenase family protein molybdopterin-binding subunit [Planctomycetota bacterium]|jgi:xanthine dehydrogenase molybdenum-binding subunit